MSMTLILVTPTAVIPTNVGDSDVGDSNSGDSKGKWLHYIKHWFPAPLSFLAPHSLAIMLRRLSRRKPVFDYVPNEIIIDILACLKIHHLCQVSRVSRLFNRITEPFLYASLGEYVGWLTPTLRSLVARPALASHVRHVTLDWWKREHGPDSGDNEKFSAMANALGLQMPWSAETQPWTNAEQPWAVEAMGFLLLHMVPNIRVLCIGQSPLLARYLESTLTIPIESLPFKFLHTLTFDEYAQQSRVTPPMLLAMMRFPSVRKVMVDLEAPEDFVHDIPGALASIIAFAGQSRVTHLSLHFGGNICSSALQHLLHMPRALTHFSYQDDWQNVYQPDPTPFRVALRVLRDTLVSLSIGGVRALRLGEPAEQTIGDFSDWPLLTKLTCTMTGLVGTRATATARVVDMLPLGIREFGLRRSDGLSELPLSQEWTAPEMTDQLFEVVHKRPELKVVTVDMEDKLYYEEMMKSLAVASGTRDVAVVVKTNELFGRV